MGKYEYFTLKFHSTISILNLTKVFFHHAKNI